MRVTNNKGVFRVPGTLIDAALIKTTILKKLAA